MKLLRITAGCPISYRSLLQKYRIRAADWGWVIEDMDASEIVDFMESLIRDPLAVKLNGRTLRHSDFEIVEQ